MRQPIAVFLLCFLAACVQRVPLEPPPLNTGEADFSNLMAIGDDLMAGVTDGVLIEYGQAFSIPQLIAKQAKVPSFRQPVLKDPGYGLDPLSGQNIGKYLLLSYVPLNVNSISLSVSPYGLVVTPPADSAPVYQNLAVPGHTLQNLMELNSTLAGMTNLILRGQGSQLEQLLAAKPTFVLCWIGFNDVLGTLISGRVIDGATITPLESFRQRYTELMDQMKALGTQAVVATIPDVTQLPFVRTLPAYLLDYGSLQPILQDSRDSTSFIFLSGRWSDGSVRQLSHRENDPNFALLTMRALHLLRQGYGYPEAFGGLGLALTDRVVLDADEVSFIRTRVQQFNEVITAEARERGFVVVQTHDLFSRLYHDGYRVGGIHLTTRYVTGGLFSLDAVHPTTAGYAILANAFIEAINAEFDANLPPVNIADALRTRR